MTLRLKNEIEAHEGSVTEIKYSKDFRYLISSGQDGIIQFFACENAEHVASLHGHMGAVNTFVTNGSDSQMISGGADCSLVWWDIEKQADIKRLKCHKGAVNSICMNPNYGITVSGSTDSTVQLWDNRNNSNFPIQILSDAKDSVTAVCANRNEIFTASLDGKLRIYDVRNEKVTTDDMGVGIMHIELSPDNHALLISTKDSKIKLVATTTGDVYQNYEGALIDSCPIKTCFAAKVFNILSGSESGEGFLWDTKDATLKHKIKFGEGPVVDVAATEPFTSIALASTNGHIGIFELAEQE